MITQHLMARSLVRRIDSGNAWGASGPLLERAWQAGRSAQQLNRDLDVQTLRQEIQETVSDLARRRLEKEEEARPRPTFSLRAAPSTRVIAVSHGMQQVLRTCDGFARYDTPVLIVGEDRLVQDRLIETPSLIAQADGGSISRLWRIWRSTTGPGM